MVFDTLIKEKAKKEKEELATFIYDHITGLSQNYTYNKILTNADYNWRIKEISKGEIVQLEGQ